MEYLNVKAMNDALARFPAVLAELEAMAAELETAAIWQGQGGADAGIDHWPGLAGSRTSLRPAGIR